MSDERMEALEHRIAELDHAEQEQAQRIAELEAAIVRRPRWRARSVMAAAVVLSIGISGVAVGVTGSPLLEGARNPAVGAASQQTSFVSNNAAGYTAAMQNVNGSDGGALAGMCQATKAREACVAGANFGSGRAFDFFAGGSEAGRIQVANPASRPLTTNATGVATGFNADKVDGKDAGELGVVGFAHSDGCVAKDDCPLKRSKNVTSLRLDVGVGIVLCAVVTGVSRRAASELILTDIGTKMIWTTGDNGRCKEHEVGWAVQFFTHHPFSFVIFG